MTFETYANILEEVQALAGVFFEEDELPRILAFANRRQRKAYEATDFWSRYLRGPLEKKLSLTLPNVLPVQGIGDAYPISVVIRIYDANPVTRNSAKVINFYQEGVTGWKLLGPEILGPVWVVFKDPAPARLTATSKEIPDEWAAYMAQGAYADHLKAEGQQDKASEAEAEAGMILQDRIIQFSDYTRIQMLSGRFGTNASHQFRHN